jgi:hypothetical protein
MRRMVYVGHGLYDVYECGVGCIARGVSRVAAFLLIRRET